MSGFGAWRRMLVAAALTGTVLVSAAPANSSVDWYTLTAETFERLPETQQRIEPAEFDRPLMTAAIFHATNRVRRQLGLPLLKHLPKLDEAADVKASIGVLEDELKHESNLPFNGTPAERVTSVGLDYEQVAENIARLPSYDLGTNEKLVGVRRVNGRDEFFRLSTGRKVEQRTYASFAENVVASWMKSPGHRANIVNPTLTFLGCSARPCQAVISGHHQVYAVQVFFTPMQ